MGPVLVVVGQFIAANWVQIAMVAASSVYSHQRAAAARREAKRAMEAQLNAGKRLQVQFGSVEPRNVIYGTSAIAGVMTAVNTTGTKGAYFNKLQVIADHPCHDFLGLYINEQMAYGKDGTRTPAYKSGSTYYFDARTSIDGAGVMNGTIISWFDGDITSAHKFTSCSYFASRYTHDKYQNMWGNGPTDAVAVVDGKEVFDPRDNTVKFSTNPALCILDYLRSVVGVEWDELNTASFIEAANDCDVMVDVTGSYTVAGVHYEANSKEIFVPDQSSFGDGVYAGAPVTGSDIPYGTVVTQINATPWENSFFISNPTTGASVSETLYFGRSHAKERAYTLNGVVWLDQSPTEVLKQMLTSCRGKIIYDGGEFYLKVAKWREPVMTLTLGDVLEEFDIQTDISQRESANCIRGTYINPTNFYKVVEFPPVTSSLFVAEDGGYENWLDIDLTFTTTPSMCQRIAKQELYLSRLKTSLTLKTNLKAIPLQVTDNIYFIYDKAGWTAPGKTFEVTAIKKNISEGWCEVALRETDETAFLWNVTDEQFVSGSNQPQLNDPFYVPAPTMSYFSASTAELHVYPDGTILPGFEVQWDLDDERVQSVEVEYRLDTDANWTFAGAIQTSTRQEWLRHDLPTQSVDLHGRIRSRSWLGRFSDWVYGTTYVYGKSTAPTTASNLIVEAAGGGVIAHWDKSPDVDRAYTIVYAHTSSVFNETHLFTTTPAESTYIPSEGGSTEPINVWIREVDTTGHTSSLVGPVSATPLPITSTPAVWGRQGEVFMMADASGFIEFGDIPWATASAYAGNHILTYDAGLSGPLTFLVDTASVVGASAVTWSGQFMKIHLGDSPPQMDDPSYVYWYGRAKDSYSNVYAITGSFTHYRVMEGPPGLPGPSASAGPSAALLTNIVNGTIELISSGSPIPNGNGYKTPYSTTSGAFLGLWSGSVIMDLGNSGSYFRYNEASQSIDIRADTFRHASNMYISSSLVASGTIYQSTKTDQVFEGGLGRKVHIWGTNNAIVGSAGIESVAADGTKVSLLGEDIVFSGSYGEAWLVQSASNALAIVDPYNNNKVGTIHATASYSNKASDSLTSTSASHAEEADFATNATNASVALFAIDATSASYAESSSYAATSSWARNLVGGGTGSFTGSFTGSLKGDVNGTASWAQNLVGQGSGSFNGTFTGNFTGSYTGSFTGNLTGTSSFASNALSSSYAVSASFARNSTNSVSASFASSSISSSFAQRSISSSYANTSSWAANFNGSGTGNFSGSLTGSLFAPTSASDYIRIGTNQNDIHIHGETTSSYGSWNITQSCEFTVNQYPTNLSDTSSVFDNTWKNTISGVKMESKTFSRYKDSDNVYHVLTSSAFIQMGGIALSNPNTGDRYNRPMMLFSNSEIHITASATEINNLTILEQGLAYVFTASTLFVPTSMTASNAYIYNARIVASTFSGSLFGTASYATYAKNADIAYSCTQAGNASTADYASNAGSANAVAWGNVSGKPSGIVSSSVQINTGSFSGSFQGQFTGSVRLVGSASSGSNTVTLTNAPIGVSGNPTGWLTVNINGTNRFVPFW